VLLNNSASGTCRSTKEADKWYLLRSLSSRSGTPNHSYDRCSGTPGKRSQQFFTNKLFALMANYATSVLAKGQAVVTQKNQAPEQRRKIPTVMELALKNQEYSIPNAPDLRKSDLRPVEIYYQNDVAAGSATSKSHLHTGTYGDSGKVELTYVTHVETMSLPRKIAQNNILTYQQMFNNLYEMKWKNLRNRHDNSALAFLIANRMQLSAAVINAQIASANPGTYSEANYALEIDATKASRFAQKAKDYMAARLYMGQYDVVADLQIASEFEFANQQGTGNNTNLGWQFADMNISRTQSVVSSAYGAGAMLILPAGLFAGMYWNDALNKSDAVNSPETEVGVAGTVKDPFGSPAIADISMYTKRADTSANTTGGSTQDWVDEWELSLTVAYALPPLSTAGESVVHMVGQSS
jgi:hypothetical protein